MGSFGSNLNVLVKKRQICQLLGGKVAFLEFSVTFPIFLQLFIFWTFLEKISMSGVKPLIVYGYHSLDKISTALIDKGAASCC